MHMRFTLCVLAFCMFEKQRDVSAFLLDTLEDCVAPPLCDCSGPTIDCSGKRFPAIPTVNLSKHYNTLYLHLEHNNVLLIPPDSFSELNSSINHLYLDLSYNRLRDIHPDAFVGVEDKITILKLQHNIMTTLPSALANLSSLVILDVHGNPIKTFASSVIGPLGTHLEFFYVGSSAMDHWPNNFQQLKTLKALYLYDIDTNNIPHHAFQGFSDSLERLDINGTKLQSIPSAICSLTNLTYLYFVNNDNIHQDSLLPSCKQPLTSVNRVLMDNNNLTSIPDVFALFPNLVTLSVSNNPNLSSFATNITFDTHLVGLTLRNNSFGMIPNEINDFSHLQTLDISYNNISHINDNDFDDLRNLSFIDLSENPIEIIDMDAFSNMSAVYHISLNHVDLSELPVALLDLENARTIDYKNNNINCTCDEIGWLKNWTSLSDKIIIGDCSGPKEGQSIWSFMTLNLPFC